MSIKPIALYLPQYHPIPENDAWWGKGFTEWINVTRAAPKFPGHYQPHLPRELGFYDLRVLETMEDQAALAQAYGIYGFCYYHYWFSGKRLLQRPLEQMLSQGRPDMPFCLCWANEAWSRRWDGLDAEILIDQHYSEQDDRNHILHVISYFKDDRYIKVNGRPVYVMYRPELHPDILRATSIWRAEVKKAGFEDLYLIRVENFLKDIDPESHGFDAGMEFAPDFVCAGRPYLRRYPTKFRMTRWLHRKGIRKSGYFENNVYGYDTLVDNTLKKPPVTYKRFRSVCPSWDNSARRKVDATIFHGATPGKFGSWVRETVKYTADHFDGEEQLFFINAWNEWGEGCHLEPDQQFGLSYLEALKAGLGVS